MPLYALSLLCSISVDAEARERFAFMFQHTAASCFYSQAMVVSASPGEQI